MGSSTSKQAAPPHVWRGTSPITISSNLVESLQNSSETDLSRHQTLELHIQSRVAAELRRLEQQEASSLSAMKERISSSSSHQEEDENNPLAVSRRSVARGIDALSQKLASRTARARPLPESIESARFEVARCLVEKDRRPLDCWREVERFKEEVRRLEKGWVDEVVG